MPSVNKVMFMGNLCRDPQLEYTPSNTPVCKVSLASNRKYGEGKEEVTYADVTIWGKIAEATNKHMQKGCCMFIEGRLKFDQWTTQDGQKRSKLSITAESVQFISWPQNAKQAVPEEEIPF